MTLITGLAVIGIVALNVIWMRYLQAVQKDARAERAGRELAYGHERQELLNRIQHPELVPIPRPDVPDEELLNASPDDEYDLVGTIRHDEP